MTDPMSGLPDANARVIPPAGISVIMGAIVVYAGHVTEDTPITERVVVGGVFLVVSLSFMHAVSPGLSDVFALLVLVALVLRYGVGILRSIGLSTAGE